MQLARHDSCECSAARRFAMATTTDSERLTSSEFTQESILSDLSQQPWLIGLAVGLGALLLFNRLRRPAEQEKAARHLVRDWRKVDDVAGARDLLGENLPAVMRPALLRLLAEIERQTDRGFRRLERSIEHL
jgi:hypothetical protein